VATVTTLNTKAEFDSLVKRATSADERRVVVVYGDNLDAAGVVSGLQAAGVPAARLMYVVPAAEDTAFDGDAAVREAIITSFKLAGITVGALCWRGSSRCPPCVPRSLCSRARPTTAGRSRL
jgi:hypothetical protein